MTDTLGDKLSSQQKGVTRVMEQHDKLSRELLKERRDVERLRRDVREKDAQLDKLHSELRQQTHTDRTTPHDAAEGCV